MRKPPIRAYTLDDALEAMEAFFGGRLKTEEQRTKMQHKFNGNIPFKMEHPKGLVKNPKKEFIDFSPVTKYNRDHGVAVYTGD